MKLFRPLFAAVAWLADLALDGASAIWLARAGLLELAGGALLVAAAWMVHESAGVAVAGLWLSLQAYGVRRGRPS